MSLNIYIYTYGYYYPDGRKTSVFFKKIFIGHIKDFLTCIFIPFSHFSLWNICQPNRKVPNNDSFGSLFSIQLDSDGYIHIFFPFYWTVVCDNVIRFFKGDLITLKILIPILLPSLLYFLQLHFQNLTVHWFYLLTVCLAPVQHKFLESRDFCLST